MTLDNKMVEVGEYCAKFNEILGLTLPSKKICYSRKGLPAHLMKSRHANCLKYIDDLSSIIKSPDYIGVNPKEPGQSIELIKVLDDNVLLGIKFDASCDYFYVASIYDIPQSKLNRRLHSGRLKPYLK